MTTTVQTAAADSGAGTGASPFLVSADSHLLEPRDLWERRLPPGLAGRMPQLPVRREDKPGATEPTDREQVMREDGVSMEVIYPTFGLTQFGYEDPQLQEACFRVYNDWAVEYCAATPGRLVAVPMLPTYDIDKALAELERTNAMGMVGGLLWHVPPEGLSYTGSHYDRLFAAAAEMRAPINLHILTGFSYTKGPRPSGVEQYRGSVETKVNDAIHVLFDFIFYGILDRFPELKLVLVEFEIGWIPWILQQWDYYAKRFVTSHPTGLDLLPSEYFDRQVYATFVKDPAGSRHFSSGWGIENCMWSNDFPHGNTSWPNSRDVIERDLADLSEEARSRLLWRNVAELYGLDLPAPIA